MLSLIVVSLVVSGRPVETVWKELTALQPQIAWQSKSIAHDFSEDGILRLKGTSCAVTLRDGSFYTSQEFAREFADKKPLKPGFEFGSRSFCGNYSVQEQSFDLRDMDAKTIEVSESDILDGYFVSIKGVRVKEPLSWISVSTKGLKKLIRVKVHAEFVTGKPSDGEVQHDTFTLLCPSKNATKLAALWAELIRSAGG
jgi:hypothetical protein